MAVVEARADEGAVKIDDPVAGAAEAQRDLIVARVDKAAVLHGEGGKKRALPRVYAAVVVYRAHDDVLLSR